eukprot:jgi/Undpi1/12723/HiC_scaffold_6.g02391.m1
MSADDQRHLDNHAATSSANDSADNYFRLQQQQQQEALLSFNARFPFVQKEYHADRAVAIAQWAIMHGIEDYPDKNFGCFVWKVVESRDHESLVRAQLYFEFLYRAWVEMCKPSWGQVTAAKEILDKNVRRRATVSLVA